MKPYFLSMLLTTLTFGLFSQEPLSINTEYNWTPEYIRLSGQLFVFGRDQNIEAKINQILDIAGHPRNFRVIASNVRSVAAILSDTTRYVLYSKRYFNELSSPYLQYALLAQAIGRHLSGHRFSLNNFEYEQNEANEFMGYMLFKLGASWEQIRMIRIDLQQMDKTPLNINLPGPKIAFKQIIYNEEIIKIGFNRAKSSILVAPSAGFAEEGKGIAVLGLKQFPMPPQKPSTMMQLNEHFIGCSTLRDVYKVLIKALKTRGYDEIKHYFVKGGFAIVTRIEVMSDKGYSLQGNKRWDLQSPYTSIFDVQDYVHDLFMPDPIYSRIFAFVVTDQIFTPNKELVITYDDFKYWLGEGSSRVPDEILDRPYHSNSGVDALIYVFTSPGNQQPLKFNDKFPLLANQHLTLSQILPNIKNNVCKRN